MEESSSSERGRRRRRRRARGRRVKGRCCEAPHRQCDGTFFFVREESFYKCGPPVFSQSSKTLFLIRGHTHTKKKERKRIECLRTQTRVEHIFFFGLSFFREEKRGEKEEEEEIKAPFLPFEKRPPHF